MVVTLKILMFLFLFHTLLSCTEKHESQTDRRNAKPAKNQLNLPVIADQAFKIRNNRAFNGTIRAFDPENLRLKFKLISHPQTGKIILTPTGKFTFISSPGFKSSDECEVQVTNSKGMMANAKITFSIQINLQ